MHSLPMITRPLVVEGHLKLRMTIYRLYDWWTNCSCVTVNSAHLVKNFSHFSKKKILSESDHKAVAHNCLVINAEDVVSQQIIQQNLIIYQ